jgi:hypothetical protein
LRLQVLNTPATFLVGRRSNALAAVVSRGRAHDCVGVLSRLDVDRGLEPTLPSALCSRFGLSGNDVFLFFVNDLLRKGRRE